MLIPIADDILEAAEMSPSDVLQELALTLFQQNRLTLEGASRLAGLDQLSFQRLLASRHIPLHYDTTDLAADVQTLEQLGWL